MKAYMLGAQLLALPVDTEVVIDGGVGVDELPVRWVGTNEDGSRFLICVAVPEPDEAAYLRTLGIDPPTAPEPEASGALKTPLKVGAWLFHRGHEYEVLGDPADGVQRYRLRKPGGEWLNSTASPEELLGWANDRRASWEVGPRWQAGQPPREACRWRNKFGAEGTATPVPECADHWRVVWDNRPGVGLLHYRMPSEYEWTPMPDEKPETIRRGESKTISITVDGESLGEFVHPDEHERVKAAAKRVLRSLARVDASDLRWERWARDLSGLSKASPEAVRARLSSLIDGLAEYRELARDIGDVRDPATPDAELRAALVADYEEMARDAAKAMRLERERDKARGLHKTAVRLGGEVAESFRVASDRLDAKRKQAGGLATEVARLQRELDRLVLLLGGEQRHAAEAQRERGDYRVWAKGHVGMDLPGDSDEDLRRVLSDRLRLSDGFRRGVTEGRRLEREKAAQREQTHDEDVRAARDRSEARADFEAEDRAHLAAAREGCAARLKGKKRGDHVYTGDAHARSHAEGWDAADEGIEHRLRGRVDDGHYIAQHTREAFDAGYTDTDERLRNGSMPRTACLWSDLATWTSHGVGRVDNGTRWSIWRLCASWPDVERRCRARADFEDRNLTVDP